jgi:hypothetical protein
MDVREEKETRWMQILKINVRDFFAYVCPYGAMLACHKIF